MAAGPSIPVSASSNIPPPVTNLPFGQVQADGSVFLTVTGLEFLQKIWASIQGGGGIIDIGFVNQATPGSNTARTLATIDAANIQLKSPVANTADVRQSFEKLMLLAPPSKDIKHDITDAILLSQRPQVPAQIQTLLDSLGTDQGDIIYRSSAGWVVLAPGSRGQILQTMGASNNPQWITSTTVAALPTSPADGARGFVNDCTLATFGLAAVGGGVQHVPVYYDSRAAAWLIG